MCEKNEKQCYVKQENRKRKHEQKEWDPEKEKQQTMWKERRGLQILPATVLSAVVSAPRGRDGVRLLDELFSVADDHLDPGHQCNVRFDYRELTVSLRAPNNLDVLLIDFRIFTTSDNCRI